MRTLTRAEEQIMQVLWRLERAFVKEIVEQFPAPRPHYNTVSTLIKILMEKGFVDYKAYGKSYQYFPLISKDDYSKRAMKNFLKGYFEGSFRNMVSFFVKEKDISVRELEALVDQIRKTKPAKK